MLSRDGIVDAALRIADAEGLEAVSIRRVAADLSVRPMSLYTHIERKEDLLTLMRDRATAEVLFRDGLPQDWREALTAIASRTRDVVLRHPWMVEIHDAPLGPNAFRHLEESMIALRSLSLDPVTAGEVLSVVDRFVMGTVSFELTRHGEPSGPLEPYLAEMLASGDYPELSRAAAGGALSLPNFERGLTWLLDGIEADVAQRR